jgi:hypothetical protein
MRAKPPTGSDYRLRRPTAFEQSRHVAVIHGQFGKSPYDRECVVGPGEVSWTNDVKRLQYGEGKTGPLIRNQSLTVPSPMWNLPGRKGINFGHWASRVQISPLPTKNLTDQMLFQCDRQRGNR